MQKRLFSELGLSEPILKAVEKLGFEQTSPIQSAAIPALMSGKDILGQSATGSGKTAAFAIPAIERVGDGDRKVQILVLTPTRELCTQVADEFARLSYFRPKVHAVPIYGGASYDRQFSELRKGPQIVIGTPGRVIDHLGRNTLDLSEVKMVILDECDRMLDMGFREDIERILRSAPKERQNVFFSATLPPPIRRLIDEFAKQPEHIKIEAQALTVPTVSQVYFDVPPRMKMDALTRLIDIHDARLAIVFANTQRMVDDIADALAARGYSTDRLHGGMSQMMRTRTMAKFKKSEFEVLVATDVAGRGIDVDELDLVINFDLPYDPEDYVHRIGRTGRAGRSGVALTLLSGREIYRLQNIERLTKVRIRRGTIPTWDMVEEKRMSGVLEKVREAITTEAHASRTVYIDQLMDEGLSATDLSAAMLHLLLQAEGIDTNKPDADPFARRGAPAPAPVAKGKGKPAPEPVNLPVTAPVQAKTAAKTAPAADSSAPKAIESPAAAPKKDSSAAKAEVTQLPQGKNKPQERQNKPQERQTKPQESQTKDQERQTKPQESQTKEQECQTKLQEDQNSPQESTISLPASTNSQPECTNSLPERQNDATPEPESTSHTQLTAAAQAEEGVGLPFGSRAKAEKPVAAREEEEEVLEEEEEDLEEEEDEQEEADGASDSSDESPDASEEEEEGEDEEEDEDSEEEEEDSDESEEEEEAEESDDEDEESEEEEESEDEEESADDESETADNDGDMQDRPHRNKRQDRTMPGDADLPKAERRERPAGPISDLPRPVPGYKWITISIGKTHGVKPLDIINAITADGEFPAAAVGLIRLFDETSSIQVKAEKAADIVDTLDGGDFEGRKIKAYFPRSTPGAFGKKPGSFDKKPGFGPKKTGFGKGGKYPPRDFGDRPRKSFGDRDDRGGFSSDRPRKSYGDREGGGFSSDRPRRSFGDREGGTGGGSYGDRPSYPRKPRSFDGPPRDGERPSYPRKPRSFDGPPRDDDRRPSFRDRDDDRPRKSFGDGPRKSGGFKKPGGFGGGKPGGFKKKGPGRW